MRNESGKASRETIAVIHHTTKHSYSQAYIYPLIECSEEGGGRERQRKSEDRGKGDKGKERQGEGM